MAGKKKRRTDEGESPSLPLTPMIDCVFLLLIFFMLACKFKTSEGKLKAYLPKDRGLGTSTPTIDLGEMRVKLLWCMEGTTKEFRKRVVNEKFEAYYDKVRHGGHVVLKVKKRYFDNVTSRDQRVWPDYNALFDYIMAAKGHYKAPSFDPTKEMPLIIDARESVPWKHVVAVLNAAVKAELHDITFAAPEIVY